MNKNLEFLVSETCSKCSYSQHALATIISNVNLERVIARAVERYQKFYENTPGHDNVRGFKACIEHELRNYVPASLSSLPQPDFDYYISVFSMCAETISRYVSAIAVIYKNLDSIKDETVRNLEFDLDGKINLIHDTCISSYICEFCGSFDYFENSGIDNGTETTVFCADCLDKTGLQ